jgi:hypothetical protein
MSSNKPFPSSDLDVFKENSLILDNFVNSQENEYPDRFNRKRSTITGIIKEAFNVRTDISNMNETLIGQSRWDVVPKNTSLSLGGDNGALNKQAQALFNRTEMLKVHAREALRRTYLESGYNLVEGSFEQGAIITSATDVVLHEKTGKCYSGPIGVVPKGTTPLESTDWVVVNNETLLETLLSQYGGGLIGSTNYAGVRSYVGTGLTLMVYGRDHRHVGSSGIFRCDIYDKTSADDDGTILIDGNGRRWKRDFTGLPNIEWWGTVPDWDGNTGTDNTSAFQKAYSSYPALFHPPGRYLTNELTLNKGLPILVGPGDTYGSAELVYRGSKALFNCDLNVAYVTLKDGMLLTGVPSDPSAYYNSGSVAIDISTGSTSIRCLNSWIRGFETLFKANYNNFYNRFEGNRFEKFKYGLYNFSSNNLHFKHNRVEKFNTLIRANGGNGPLVIESCSLEVFNGQIVELTGEERGVVTFNDNYVELYEGVSLPTNFPRSMEPKTDNFGGNILFTGPIGVFTGNRNDLKVSAAFRYFSPSGTQEYIESVGNFFHTHLSGNNLEKIWSTQGAGSVNINDNRGADILSDGGYNRSYAATAIPQFDIERRYYMYDPIASRTFRPPEANHVLTLNPGWRSWDLESGPLTVVKTNGRVDLIGTLVGTTGAGKVIATIPVKYRPEFVQGGKKYVNISVHANYGSGTNLRIRYVLETGELLAENEPSTFVDVIFGCNSLSV